MSKGKSQKSKVEVARFVALHCCLFTFVLGHLTSAQSVEDATLRVNRWVGGLKLPTGVAFLDSNTALVTEKETGRVRLVENRQITATVLDLPVANDSERGLLSIALSPHFATDRFVYLYHSAADSDGGDPIANRISRYRYNASAKQLVFDRDIIDLPGGPGPNHDGGKILFAPNGKLFAVVGDLNHRERTQNFESSDTLTRSGMIIRINPSGSKVGPSNPFNTNAPGRKVLDDVWAYGVRNSFGLAIDPVSGDLWDTENGPDRMDEINRVPAGFNSGWRDVMGPVGRSGSDTSGLVSLGPRAAYSDPELSWATPVAPTDLEFMNNSKLGSAYRNDLFVGDVLTGSIFHFDLSSDRRSLALSGALADRVADNSDGDLLNESESHVFGSDFGTVSDLVSRPDGLYALSLSNGALYRITRNPGAGAVPQSHAFTNPVPEPSGFILAMMVIATTSRRSRRRGTAVAPR